MGGSLCYAPHLNRSPAMARRQRSHVFALLGRLTENQRGVTGVEYTIIAATISVAAIVGMNMVGGGLLTAIGNWMF